MSKHQEIYEMFDIVENARSKISPEIRIKNLNKAEADLILMKNYLKKSNIANKRQLVELAGQLLHNIKSIELEQIYRENGIIGINANGNYRIKPAALDHLKKIIQEGKWRNSEKQNETQQPEPDAQTQQEPTILSQREQTVEALIEPATNMPSESIIEEIAQQDEALSNLGENTDNEQNTAKTRKNKERDAQKTKEYYIILNHKIKMINEQLKEANGDPIKISKLKKLAKVDDNLEIDLILGQRGREVFYKPVGVNDNKNHICKWTSTLFFPKQLEEYLKGSFIGGSSKHRFLQKNLPELFSNYPQFIINLD